MRRVLITGGAGFIGSHLTDLLLSRGDEVTIVDNLSTGRLGNIPAATRARVRFIEAELSSALAAFGPGELFDEIYHLAAAVGVRLVVDDPIGCIETNIIGTAHLLRFALRHGPGGGPAPTLVASSSEVYGKSEKVPFSEDDDVVYGPTTRSRWSYATSKAVDEYLALAHHTTHRLPVVVTRFFNTVGPRQVGAYGMVLPNFVAAAIEDRPIPIYGDGLQVRCLCDVRDVVDALPRLMGSAACHGRVFNVGSDRPLTIDQLADRVIAVLGSSSTKQFIPYDTAYAAGFEDLRRRVPDLSRIRAAIGFAPRIDLDQTIRDIAGAMRAAGNLPIEGVPS
ncbi:MAG: GDP-mannose 4,6-dehydratase [Phycisphaerales bacterium]|nr:GDP-mannose 4,6-dehydratase [Phycisphaerales bacterium]